jgi:hypothetical protein
MISDLLSDENICKANVANAARSVPTSLINHNSKVITLKIKIHKS